MVNMTRIEESSSDHFILMQNSTPHEPETLQLPDYVPALYVNNDGLEDLSRFTIDGRTMHVDGSDAQLEHYHADMAAFLQLGKWFDYLRDNGVYDNTRIIIVSDHGRGLAQFDDLILPNGVDLEWVTPLLMVKDFNSHGFTTSNEFMTNADTPTLAVDGLIADPVNPYTGVPISSNEKYAHSQVITLLFTWEANELVNETTFDLTDGYLYSVHDNIYDIDNWTLISEPEKENK
jgi:hypothetical protein